eukprot:scpid102638/ scgid16359/ 
MGFNGESLATELLKILEENFARLDEVGLIPGLPSSSAPQSATANDQSLDHTSSECFVLVDSKLGIYSGCAAALFPALYRKFMQCCQSRRASRSDREEDEGGRGNGDGAAAAAGVASAAALLC